MKKNKHHPFYQAPAGQVFAIAVTPEKWGFVRFFRGNAMAVLTIVSSVPEMPDVDWKNAPTGWIFSSFAYDSDTTEAILLGCVPFTDEASEWAPPCFTPPDRINNCYKIHDRWGIRRATERETEGMRRCQRVTPARLAEFLREKLSCGELRIV
jgi:hypothetical protein